MAYSNKKKQKKKNNNNKYWYFSYCCMKMYIVGTPLEALTMVLLMSTHNICLYAEIRRKKTKKHLTHYL